MARKPSGRQSGGMKKAASNKATSKKPKKRPVEAYAHPDKKRANNPPVGLVTPDTDPDAGQNKTYQYDPHLDPQLVWAGKAEHTSFDVPTVSCIRKHASLKYAAGRIRLSRAAARPVQQAL